MKKTETGGAGGGRTRAKNRLTKPKQSNNSFGQRKDYISMGLVSAAYISKVVLLSIPYRIGVDILYLLFLSSSTTSEYFLKWVRRRQLSRNALVVAVVALLLLLLNQDV
jgi:hypothetical protein